MTATLSNEELALCARNSASMARRIAYEPTRTHHEIRVLVFRELLKLRRQEIEPLQLYDVREPVPDYLVLKEADMYEACSKYEGADSEYEEKSLATAASFRELVHLRSQKRGAT